MTLTIIVFLSQDQEEMVGTGKNTEETPSDLKKSLNLSSSLDPHFPSVSLYISKETTEQKPSAALPGGHHLLAHAGSTSKVDAQKLVYK